MEHLIEIDEVDEKGHITFFGLCKDGAWRPIISLVLTKDAITEVLRLPLVIKFSSWDKSSNDTKI